CHGACWDVRRVAGALGAGEAPCPPEAACAAEAGPPVPGIRERRPEFTPPCWGRKASDCASWRTDLPDGPVMWPMALAAVSAGVPVMAPVARSPTRVVVNGVRLASRVSGFAV